MKKLIMIMLFSLILVGCSTSNTGVVICEKEFQDDLVIHRTLSLSYSNNLVTSIETVDKISYNDAFTEASLEQLELELQEKLKDSKNVTYEIEKEADGILVKSKLSSLTNVSSSEYSYMGMSVNEKDQPVGLMETISLNEAAGFVCKEVE